MHEELIRQAAGSDRVYHDDTPGRIIALEKQIQKEKEQAHPGEKIRTGVFTTGIVAQKDGHSLALYFTGCYVPHYLTRAVLD